MTSTSLFKAIYRKDGRLDIAYNDEGSQATIIFSQLETAAIKKAFNRK